MPALRHLTLTTIPTTTEDMSWFLPMLSSASHLRTFHHICYFPEIGDSGEDCMLPINDMLRRLSDNSTSFLPCVQTVNFELFLSYSFQGTPPYDDDDIAEIYPALVRALHARHVPQPGVSEIKSFSFALGSQLLPSQLPPPTPDILAQLEDLRSGGMDLCIPFLEAL
ncbi:hypothetical protein C8J57DRAFT_1495171 [Mycena rebaudengoi]|nr:hypothetical protein C8J57DRAFT_1495171 [Mycena rebaudengoi]